MNRYTYNCSDKSVLLPYFKKYYVSLFFRLIPRWLTANFITLISSGFIFLMFYLTVFHHSFSSVSLAAIFALFLHNYIVGDHLDGMQAKHTGTSSALGEFLDHYLDVYNGAIVFYVLAVFLGPIPGWIFYIFLFFSCNAFALTMVEELERKELYFGPIGTLEGVIALIIFFISWLVPQLRELWQLELIAGLPAYWIVICLFGLGYVGTILDILKRLGYFPRQFVLFTFCCMVLVYLLYRQQVEYLEGWLIVTLYGGEYIAKVMESYLLNREHKYPDFAVSATIILLPVGLFSNLISLSLFHWLLAVLTLYLLLKVSVLFIRVTYQLRKDWNWINPYL